MIAALCGLTATALGYAQFRSICSTALTCDVVGADAHRYYLAHVFRPLAKWHALALALTTGLVWWRERRQPRATGFREVALGAAAVLVGWVVVLPFMARMQW